MTERDAILFGCRIKVACIGGVCTHPEYRKQGLASACFDDAIRKARADGVDIMIVSGDRNLYRMRGCVHVGGDTEYVVWAGDIRSDLSDLSDMSDLSDGIAIEVMKADELAEVEECYRSEPVRFDRPTEDYRFALESEYVMNRPSDFLVIRRNGEFCGYVIVPRTPVDGSVKLSEISGDREAFLGAVPQILSRYNLDSVKFQVMRHDSELRGLCERMDLEGTPRTTPGTVTLINFPQLMSRMRPYIVDRIRESAASLRFAEEGEEFVFELGSDRFVTDRPTAARILFGGIDEHSNAMPDVPITLAQALRSILRLPTLWYGINYV